MSALRIAPTSYSGLRDTELTVVGDVKFVEITDCPNLRRVVLPESVIGFTAIACPQLVAVELPDRLSHLTLKQCPELPAVALPVWQNFA